MAKKKKSKDIKKKNSKKTCYFAVHGRYENEVTHLGCNKRKAIQLAKKLEKKEWPHKVKVIKM